MNLFRSTVVIGSLTGVSRVLGFARDALIAAVLGAGPISDAFYAALRLPNLFRRTFLISASVQNRFIPSPAFWPALARAKPSTIRLTDFGFEIS